MRWTIARTGVEYYPYNVVVRSLSWRQSPRFWTNVGRVSTGRSVRLRPRSWPRAPGERPVGTAPTHPSEPAQSGGFRRAPVAWSVPERDSHRDAGRWRAGRDPRGRAAWTNDDPLDRGIPGESRERVAGNATNGHHPVGAVGAGIPHDPGRGRHRAPRSRSMHELTRNGASDIARLDAPAAAHRPVTREKSAE